MEVEDKNNNNNIYKVQLIFIRNFKINSVRLFFQASPQPIIITTSYPGYVPQSYQQQAPSPSPMWQLENHPMLPQPSAPPLPAESIYPDRPPSYEKAIAN